MGTSCHTCFLRKVTCKWLPGTNASGWGSTNPDFSALGPRPENRAARKREKKVERVEAAAKKAEKQLKKKGKERAEENSRPENSQEVDVPEYSVVTPSGPLVEYIVTRPQQSPQPASRSRSRSIQFNTENSGAPMIQEPHPEPPAPPPKRLFVPKKRPGYQLALDKYEDLRAEVVYLKEALTKRARGMEEGYCVEVGTLRWDYFRLFNRLIELGIPVGVPLSGLDLFGGNGIEHAIQNTWENLKNQGRWSEEYRGFRKEEVLDPDDLPDFLTAGWIEVERLENVRDVIIEAMDE